MDENSNKRIRNIEEVMQSLHEMNFQVKKSPVMKGEKRETRQLMP